MVNSFYVFSLELEWCGGTCRAEPEMFGRPGSIPCFFRLCSLPLPVFLCQGPCRKEMENVLTSLKTADILNPRGFRIPNCDKKGFYKKKQVNNKQYLGSTRCTTMLQPNFETVRRREGRQEVRGEELRSEIFFRRESIGSNDLKQMYLLPGPSTLV